MERCRRYTRNTFKGTSLLVSWIQLRCERCKRFLGKHQLKYCSRCAPIVLTNQRKEWNNNHPSYLKEWRHKKGISTSYRGIS